MQVEYLEEDIYLSCVFDVILFHLFFPFYIRVHRIRRCCYWMCGSVCAMCMCICVCDYCQSRLFFFSIEARLRTQWFQCYSSFLLSALSFLNLSEFFCFCCFFVTDCNMLCDCELCGYKRKNVCRHRSAGRHSIRKRKGWREKEKRMRANEERPCKRRTKLIWMAYDHEHAWQSLPSIAVCMCALRDNIPCVFGQQSVVHGCMVDGIRLTRASQQMHSRDFCRFECPKCLN